MPACLLFFFAYSKLDSLTSSFLRIFFDSLPLPYWHLSFQKEEPLRTRAPLIALLNNRTRTGHQPRSPALEAGSPVAQTHRTSRSGSLLKPRNNVERKTKDKIRPRISKPLPRGISPDRPPSIVARLVAWDPQPKPRVRSLSSSRID